MDELDRAWRQHFPVTHETCVGSTFEIARFLHTFPSGWLHVLGSDVASGPDSAIEVAGRKAPCSGF